MNIIFFNPLLIVFLIPVMVLLFFLFRSKGSTKYWIVPIIGLVAVLLLGHRTFLRLLGSAESSLALPSSTRFNLAMIVILVILAVTALFGYGSRTTRWTVGIIVAIILFFGAFFFYAQPVHTTTPTSHSQVNPIGAIVVQQENFSQISSPTPPVWSAGIEQEFIADVYPSQTAAARALGQQVISFLPPLTHDKQMPATVQIFGQTDPHKLTAETLHALADGLRSTESVQQVLVETVQIDVASSIYTNDPQAVSIEVSLPKYSYSHMYKNSPTGPVTSGTVSLNLMGQNNRLNRTASFVQKPWVENFAAFVNQDQKTWHLARSQNSCTNQNDAQQQALSDACRQVTSILQQWFQQQKMSLLPLSVNPIDLEQAGIITDRFVQSFEGTAGRIWRQALLLDLSPEKLNQLAQKHLRIATATRQSWFHSIFTMAGLLALICLIYFFLNMATRGYYTWAIRIAMGVLFAVGVGMILLIS